MGKEIIVNNLDDMCALMCDNALPEETKPEYSYEEIKEYQDLLGNWLKNYSGDTVVKVMAKAHSIISNEHALNMLKELKKREEKELKDFKESMGYLLQNYDGFSQYDPHNHVLEHSQSYRDILYDMYIREV